MILSSNNVKDKFCWLGHIYMSLNKKEIYAFYYLEVL